MESALSPSSSRQSDKATSNCNSDREATTQDVAETWQRRGERKREMQGRKAQGLFKPRLSSPSAAFGVLQPTASNTHGPRRLASSSPHWRLMETLRGEVRCKQARRRRSACTSKATSEALLLQASHNSPPHARHTCKKDIQRVCAGRVHTVGPRPGLS